MGPARALEESVGPARALEERVGTARALDERKSSGKTHPFFNTFLPKNVVSPDNVF